MDVINFYEMLGYSASMLVALSLTMRSVVRLRVITPRRLKGKAG